MDPDDGEMRRARWPDDELPLFGVLGLRRVRGGSQTAARSRPARTGERPATVVMSEGVRFVSPDGASISVTSHRGDDDERYARTRSWAPVNPYLAARRGQAAGATGDGPVPGPPPEVDWSATTIVVDGIQTPFELAELGAGLWVAIGRVPGTIISVDSRGVPASAVRLQRLTDDHIPPPPRPDLGENGDTALDALDERFEHIPFHRIRRPADYWALLDVEAQHVDKVARQHHLSAHHAKALHQYWSERIEARLAATLDGFRRSRSGELGQSRLARRLGRGFVFQLWFNTLGPGARTWLGNRYAGIRRHTFRIRWRP